MPFNSPLINFFKDHKAFLLVLIVFVTYSPTVLNKFVGDDHLLIENNVFYRSWGNVPRLLEHGYISQPRDFFSNNHDYGSGCVSYRPVLSLTYFLDYQLWGNNPYGFHLTNILIHCLNCVLFYQILLFILGPSSLSFLAVLLFGLHPVQSEAVAMIGYRADILSTAFLLSSFYFWLRFQSGGYLQMKYYGGSLLMYFLALFSKESVVMLPLVVFIYDRSLALPSKSSKYRGIYYAGFMPILIFYVYIYVFVFPNSSLYFHLLGGSTINHCLTVGYIWYSYLISLLAPWTITVLPGIFNPSIPVIFSFETLKIGVLFIVFTGILFRLWRTDKKGAFFLMWFMIFYLPVSDLIPLANPMAFRFMYLPSAGFLTVCAFGLCKVLNGDYLKRYFHYLSSLFYAAVVLICVIGTVFLNMCYKSDFDVAYSLLEHYPLASRGYALMGQEYFKRNIFGAASEYFEKSISYGIHEPRVDWELGVCYFHLGQFTKAKDHLLKVISVNPDFLDSYLLLGNIYFSQKEYGKEIQVLEKALVLAPDDPTIYINLIKMYKYLQITEKAESLLQNAKTHLSRTEMAELNGIL